MQLAMVRLNQKDLLEVFLADVWDPQTSETYYATLKHNKFRALLPAHTET